jgi:hypothetical protein
MSAAKAGHRPKKIDQRPRGLLRTLHARLFVTVEGRVFAVRGKPDPEKLRRCLTAQLRAPTAAEAPTPEQLSLNLCDGEIPPSSWHEMSRALKRWSLDHQHKCARRPAHRRAARLLAREGQELRHLAERLAACAR